MKITIVLDIVHVLEHLWRAAYAFHADGTKDAQTWVECRLTALLGGRSAGALAKDLRAKIRSDDLDESSAKSVEAAATYLTNNTRHMHYDRALAQGLPIETGVIEGACRYLVQDRMGRTGAVWSAAGAEAVLRLRALRASCDFDDYWQFTSRRSMNVRTNHATPTARSPTRFRPSVRTFPLALNRKTKPG